MRSARASDDVCSYATMHKNNGFHHYNCPFELRHLYHIFDPILFVFCNVKLCQRDNFGPRYLEKYVPHLFNFLENDNSNLQYCSKLWNPNFGLENSSTHTLDTQKNGEVRLLVDYLFCTLYMRLTSIVKKRYPFLPLYLLV